MNDDGSFTAGGNQPTLLWADGTKITKKQAREECGFKVKVLYQSPLYLNANRVEAGLQRHFKEGLGYELGQVLWRVSGAGGNPIKLDANAGSEKVVKIFMTYNLTLQRVIEEGAHGGGEHLITKV
jgi:hypothetical protein